MSRSMSRIAFMRVAPGRSTACVRQPRDWRAAPPSRGAVGTSPSRAGYRVVEPPRAGQPDVVVKDEDGALLEREPAKGALELVAVVNGQDVGRLGLAGHRQQPNVCLHAAPTPGLGVALVRQDPVQPRFESVGVAQRRSCRHAVISAACTASSARSASRRIRNAIAMQRSPTMRARASKASRSPPSPGPRALAAPTLPRDRRPGWADHTRESSACLDSSNFGIRLCRLARGAVIGNLKDLGLDRHEIAQQTAAHVVVKFGQFDRRELGVAVEVADCDRFAVR